MLIDYVFLLSQLNAQLASPIISKRIRVMKKVSFSLFLCVHPHFLNCLFAVFINFDFIFHDGNSVFVSRGLKPNVLRSAAARLIVLNFH